MGQSSPKPSSKSLRLLDSLAPLGSAIPINYPDLLDEFALIVPLMREWDTQRSRFEFLHRAISEQLALCITRVALDFFKALMTGN